MNYYSLSTEIIEPEPNTDGDCLPGQDADNNTQSN
jgi:hypothetical protein